MVELLISIGVPLMAICGWFISSKVLLSHVPSLVFTDAAPSSASDAAVATIFNTLTSTCIGAFSGGICSFSGALSFGLSLR